MDFNLEAAGNTPAPCNDNGLAQWNSNKQHVLAHNNEQKTTTTRLQWQANDFLSCT